MEEDQDLGFLHLLITEPVYVPEEPACEHIIAALQDDKAAAAPLEEPTIELAAMGENRKKILALVEEDGDGPIRQENLQLLINILKSVHLSIDDIRLVNIAQNNITPDALIRALEKTSFTTLISFGATVPAWPICRYFTKYAVSTDDTDRQILLADTLQQLADDPYKKKSLWICLQKLFH